MSVVRRRGAEHSRVKLLKGQKNTPSLRAFLARILREREIDMLREALMLRGKPPEESIGIMCDMPEFVEDLAKAVEGA
jgi:hypothetical protein